MSVSRDILRSWRSPRRVVGGILARGPREDLAIVFLMIGCGLIFLAQWPRLIAAAQQDQAVPVQAMLGGGLMGWMFIAPLVFYGIAAVIRVLMLGVGVRASWYSVRLSLFWAVLAVSPLWLLHGAVAFVAGPGPVTDVAGLLALAAFFWILAGGLGAAALEARERSA